MSDEKPATRRPANTAFKQQRLKAWQPLLTPKSVLPTLFVIGIIFAPLGGFLLHTSNSVSELVIDYTDCDSATGTHTTPANAKDLYSFSGSGTFDTPPDITWMKVDDVQVQPGDFHPEVYTTTRCYITFTIPKDMPKPVFLYYRLTSFYQNHRRYVKSFDPKQLKGASVTTKVIDDSCKPLGKVARTTDTVFYPCGLIANSVFNDTFSDLKSIDPIPFDNYTFSEKGVAWPSDAVKFGRPDYDLDPAKYVPPEAWRKRYGQQYKTWPDLVSDERLHVWMRTAGLPNFRKLYGRNDNVDLKSGRYVISIDNNFQVKAFGGTKAIVISKVSFLGGKNPFLGYAYIVVGVICVILAAVFAARHLYKPRKLGDHTYLSWNHQPPVNAAEGGATANPSNPNDRDHN